MSCAHEPDILKDREGYSAWSKSWTSVDCPYGQCVEWLCPTCGRRQGGVGAMMCPCDTTRGWKARFIDQMGKPAAPVKAKGRHADRVRNRRREVREWETHYKTLREVFG